MQWPNDRQCNGQKTDNAMAKRERTKSINNDLQDTTHKTKDRAT
jgi:hypothetical protein